MRRSRGEGGIYKRPDRNLWAASLDVPTSTGKRRRRVVYGKTRREVKENLLARPKSAQRGRLPDTGKLTVGQYLERWLEDGARPQVRRTTLASYRRVVSNHLAPAMGRAKLAKLSPMQVQRAYAEMERAGVGARTRQLAHAVLHRALEQAVRWDVIPRNPASLVSRPKVTRREARALTPDEARHLLQVASGDPLEALYVVAVTAGLRQGELFGLKWRDVDLRARTLSVQRGIVDVDGRLEVSPPKSTKGRRRIELPDLAVRALREHRASLRATPHPEAWVFPDSKGGPLRKGNFIRRSWYPLRERAGLGDVRFHDLRHAAATLLLSAGVHPKVVQERLGHSTIAVTIDVYSHVLGSLQRDAADRLDEILG